MIHSPITDCLIAEILLSCTWLTNSEKQCITQTALFKLTRHHILKIQYLSNRYGPNDMSIPFFGIHKDYWIKIYLHLVFCNVFGTVFETFMNKKNM